MEQLVWGGEKLRFAGTTVEKVGGGGERFGPPLGWHGRMEENGADAIVESAKDALCLSVLL
jgi:hypothetical protein